MKIIKNILGAFVLLAAFSCQKHVVEYDTTPIGSLAEFQLHYFVPVVAVDSNNIYKMEVNGFEYSNGTMSAAGVYNPSVLLSTYNAIPSGATARFYTATPGDNNIKLYASNKYKPVYNQSAQLKTGKQNVFVYDFNKPPMVFDNGFPYPKITTEKTGQSAWVKFYNFLYETATTPTTLKLQYQYQYTKDIVTKEKSDWIDVGKPVSFGESTGWEHITVIKEVEISQGSARIDYRIRMIGADGSDQGSLKVNNASNAFVDYSDFWTATIGRCYHHVLSGLRTTAPRSAVRQFVAL